MSEGTGIFTSAEQFEAYYARVSGTLRARRDERAAFLRSGIERLQSLQDAARALRDVELEAELARHLEAARDSLHQLETAPLPPDGR